MLTNSVGQPCALGREFVGDARPFPELHHLGFDRVEAPEEAAVGSQGVGEHPSVAAVVLGAGRREAVPEAVELLRIEGMYDEDALHHGLDHRPVRHLDRHCDPARRRPGLLEEPRRHLGEPQARMREGPLALYAAFSVDDADVVNFRSPVHTDKPLDSLHRILTCPVHDEVAAMLANPCTGARRRELPMGRPSRPTVGARVPLGARSTWDAWLLPTDWPTPGPRDRGPVVLMRPSPCMDARSRRLNRWCFRRAQRPRATFTKRST